MKLSEVENVKQNDQEQNLRHSVKELQGLSQDELMKKLLKEVSDQKEKGVFDYEKLAKTVDSIKMYLPEALYQNLLKTLESLK